MQTIQSNLEHIHQQIKESERKFGRATDSVQLLAVSKTKPNQAIVDACIAGQRLFGENYVQEGVEKVQYFQEHHSDFEIKWHFIGPIQSNKTRPISENFDWVHSIDRAKIAQRLNDQRPDDKEPLQVLIQVNTSGEASKSGISAQQTLELASSIEALPNLTLRGLMSIPAAVTSYEEQLVAFNQLKDLFEAIKAQYPQVDTLSMGMSGDMEAAIEAGSTMVRIGTAIFGARDYSSKQ
ncbi:YggS family pyridoxal phosphate enzyme [Vibrio breoganii]|uniref:YggS family pyridoxal phosphate-dependent enzyme n=1 Tax=Vibrio breoganii TaxID=553239 RepID=UPI000C82CCF6|nr:YggS family pyridoxal phosphate-dependent enzyme [Vibrio breoganii]PML08028.1 YggS family pyridoxal phosphate enzyme [Vibrio breoganii]PML37517.1 YggS family pyridoxal phosphate enzyme [Vibrio breoganii]